MNVLRELQQSKLLTIIFSGSPIGQEDQVPLQILIHAFKLHLQENICQPEKVDVVHLPLRHKLRVGEVVWACNHWLLTYGLVARDSGANVSWTLNDWVQEQRNQLMRASR